MICDLLLTVNSGSAQKLVGSIELTKAGSIRPIPAAGYEMLMQNVLSEPHLAGARKVSVQHYPVAWFEALPRQYNGSYLRAAMRTEKRRTVADLVKTTDATGHQHAVDGEFTGPKDTAAHHGAQPKNGKPATGSTHMRALFSREPNTDNYYLKDYRALTPDEANKIVAELSAKYGVPKPRVSFRPFEYRSFGSTSLRGIDLNSKLPEGVNRDDITTLLHEYAHYLTMVRAKNGGDLDTAVSDNSAHSKGGVWEKAVQEVVHDAFQLAYPEHKASIMHRASPAGSVRVDGPKTRYGEEDNAEHGVVAAPPKKQPTTWLPQAHFVRNIIAMYQEATPEEKESGARWYKNAHAVAERLASEHGVSVEQAAGVLAAFSPNADWNLNIRAAEDFLLTGTTSTVTQRPKTKPYVTSGMEHRRAATAEAEAREILAGKDPMRVLSSKQYHKTQNFFQNILDPDNEKAVTIDRHAVALSFGQRIPSDDVNAIARGRSYEEFANAYRTAAKKLGVKPAVLQATAWEHWRSTYAGTPAINTGAEAGELPLERGAVADVIAMRTFQYGGSTVSAVGEVPRDGFMVDGITDEKGQKMSEIIKGPEFNREKVEDFLVAHDAELAKPNRFAGTWIHDGKVYLDVSEIYHDKAIATARMHERGELSIFDLGTGSEIAADEPSQIAAGLAAGDIRKEAARYNAGHYLVVGNDLTIAEKASAIEDFVERHLKSKESQAQDDAAPK